MDKLLNKHNLITLGVFLAIIVVAIIVFVESKESVSTDLDDNSGTNHHSSISKDISKTDIVESGEEAIRPLTEIKDFKTINTLSDDKLLSGNYQIADTTWSLDSQSIFLTREEGMTDIGLPAYKTYDIYNLNSGELSQTNIQDSITLGTPEWSGNIDLVTPRNKVKLVDNKVLVSDKVEIIPPGYELLEEVKYCNPNLNTCKKYVSGLTFSSDNKYAAFISPYNGGQDIPYSYRLFILPQGAESLDELIWFNQIPMGVEVSTPEFRWSKDSQYLITGNNTMFKIETQEAVVPPAGYKRIYLSPDESKVIIFSVTDDSQGKRYNRAGVKVKSLVDNSEHDILTIEGGGTESREFVWLDGGFSPDGNYIVFAVSNHIWIANADTAEIYRITTESNTYRQPRWSHDGEYIIYALPEEIRLISLDYPELNISDSKTYRNYELGFEVRYPDQFYTYVPDSLASNTGQLPLLSISNNSLPIDYQDTNEIIYKLYVYENSTVQEKLDSFVSGESHSAKLGESNMTKSQITISGKTFDVVNLTAENPTESISMIFRYYYLQRGDSVYSFLLRVPQDLNDVGLIRSFEEIVGSISF